MCGCLCLNLIKIADECNFVGAKSGSLEMRHKSSAICWHRNRYIYIYIYILTISPNLIIFPISGNSHWKVKSSCRKIQRWIGDIWLGRFSFWSPQSSFSTSAPSYIFLFISRLYLWLKWSASSTKSTKVTNHSTPDRLPWRKRNIFAFLQKCFWT